MTEIVAGWLLLARAVKKPELESIRRENRFTNVVGLECKYFCTSVADALAYARLAQDSFKDGPYTIVVTAHPAEAALRDIQGAGGWWHHGGDSADRSTLCSETADGARGCVMADPDASATIALLPTDQGGRNGPTPDGWFGCVMAVGERNYDIRIALDEPLAPGTTRRVQIQFLEPRSALRVLSPGATFSLWEGREIGFGRIERLRRVDPVAAE